MGQALWSPQHETALSLSLLQPCQALASVFLQLCQSVMYRHIASIELSEKVIFQPLSKLNSSSPGSPLILVIDALDECEHDNDIRAILQLLAELKDLQSTRLLVFNTSRPEIPNSSWLPCYARDFTS